MHVDISKIINNSITSLNVTGEVIIPESYLLNSLIKELQNIKFMGKIKYDEDNNLTLTGIINGTMVLEDDVTLKPVEYKFNADLEEIIENKENILDITDVLWHNILVEIPSKVRNTDEDIELSGNGWRLISEKQFTEERSKINNPFANLQELINEKEEK